MATPSHGSGTVVAPAKVRRRRWPVVAALAAGVVIGVVWTTVTLVFNVADAVESQAQTPTEPVVTSRPPTAAGHSRRSATAPTGKTPTRSAVPSDAPTGTDPRTPSATDDPATNPYVPAKLCGSGFETIDSAPLRSDDTLVGSVYLLADGTGKTCVVTLKATDLDEKTATSAYLEPEDGARADDDGDYQYYAGPVRGVTASTCIRWGGSVDDIGFDSELEHCQ